MWLLARILAAARSWRLEHRLRGLVDRKVGRARFDAGKPAVQRRKWGHVEASFGRAMHVSVQGDVRDREAIFDQVVVGLKLQD